MLRYALSCFLLWTPVFALNVLWAGSLPPPLGMDEFWRDIPRSISFPENVLRMVVILIPLAMPLGLSTPQQRLGILVYGIGLAVYTASWAALVVWPGSAWSRSPAGLLAPAYTPALWLAGIALVGERTYFERLPYRSWMFAALAFAFLVFHNAHAALVVFRARASAA